MFGRFFKRFKPVTITDPKFGVMTNDENGIWNGRLHFAPLGADIDFSMRLPAGEVPTEQDREFFNQIELRWREIHSGLRESLFEGIDNFADGTTPTQLFDSLRFEAFVFFDMRSSPRIWEISCSTELDDHVFGIEMEELENAGFRMDG